MRKHPSLKRALIVYPLALHLVTLFASFAVLTFLAIRVDSGGPFADERIIPVVVNALQRSASGNLSIAMTPDLVDLQVTTPGIWFVVEDDGGETATFGAVPSFYRSLVGQLSQLSYAQLRDRNPPYDLAAVVRREATELGNITILAHGALSELTFTVLLASNALMLPIFGVLTVVSLLVTSWVVRRSLKGLSRIAQEAEKIDVEWPGRRLSERHLPREIAPLVRTFNEVLRRLDEGYERRKRFIASASHELRTPIAILMSKVESSDVKQVRALGVDVNRLAVLAEQLLDVERLNTTCNFEGVELRQLARSVAADVAPLLLAAGKSIEVKARLAASVVGDEGALKRVMMNLIQNAMEHGGRRIIMRVGNTFFEVQDDGPGIPLGEREQVFEAFYRLKPRSSGGGLGLNLVREVVKRHSGTVAITDAPGGGTIVRVTFSAI